MGNNPVSVALVSYMAMLNGGFKAYRASARDRTLPDSRT